MNDDINVALLDFPGRGREMVVRNEDDSYTIIINARLSHEEQLLAYRHALWHIQNNDFEMLNVQEIESHAHSTHITENFIGSNFFSK